MNKAFMFFLIHFSFFLFGVSPSLAQKKTKKKNKAKKELVIPKKKSSKQKSIKDLTKSSEKIEGLFTIYRDSIKGSLKMLIKEEQLGKEYIYFSQIRNGVTDVFLFKGRYKKSKIFKVEKHFNTIEFVTQNHSYYFDSESNLAKSKGANISEGIMESLTIEAEDKKKGVYLINCENLFFKESLIQIKRKSTSKFSSKKFQLGRLDKSKTKVNFIKNYPENTYVSSEYVYSNPSPSVYGSNAVTDSRNVSIQVDHQLIAMPKNDYKPRNDDPRIGYFTTQVTDMTSASPTPYKDLIHRWNLVKKDSTKAISEPVTPITWWMENTTPEEFKPTIKEAVLEWNKAFEKAGFKNAIVVKEQNDSLQIDAGDIRYNVLRWTASPSPPFGGYGPSFVNPRTGEILGADIMLEYLYHTNRVKLSKIFESAKQNKNHNTEEHGYLTCSFGHQIQLQTLLGKAWLKTLEANENEMKGLTLQAMKELIMHEIGHTLGLNHNMKSSQLFSLEELNTPELIKGKCLTGSVMDYSSINLAPTKEKQGQYYSTTVGPYDIWAIQYGYAYLKNESDLKAITNLSTKPELAFGNDADDMRFPGKGIDPRVMIGDMSSNQIDFAKQRLQLIEKLFPKIKTKFEKEGQSFQEFTQAFYILYSNYGNMGDIISRFIGGVYVDRSMVGQKEQLQPYTAVEYTKQKKAINTLEQYFFAPQAWKVPSNLYNYLAIQRRGFNFFKRNEDPKIHSLVLAHQKRVLAHLLHKNTLQRIIDSELYGNTYSLSEFMTDLNNSIFQKDISSNKVNSFRQNLQVYYTKNLIRIVSQGKLGMGYPEQAKALALYNLKQIQKKTVFVNGEIATKAHKTYLNTLIKSALEEL